MPNEADELLDLVDSNDQVIGVIRRGDADARGRNGNFLMAASCFVINDQDQIWVPRRQLTKTIKPGALDFSAGGHIGSGEDYLSGLLREITEEIGLNPDSHELHFIAKQAPNETKPGIYFQALYLLWANDVPHFSTIDFSGFEWLSITELRTRLANGELAKDSLAYSVEQLSAYLGEDDGNHKRHKEII